MAEAESASSSSSSSFLKRQWAELKDFWGERFSFVDKYDRFIQSRNNPKPSDSDIQAFIALDPVHGPALKAAREAAKIAVVGSAIGAVSTAGFAWKYSKSPHGALLSLGAGAVFGYTFGQEAASHWLQLYRMDTMTAQVKFLEWWERKNAGTS